ncbi:MAG: outer membrane beta-barrel protein [Prevotella sp.]|jgi:hypothetical protein|nr:outer membrane beta-barrel protein [Prevotella sp.]
MKQFSLVFFIAVMFSSNSSFAQDSLAFKPSGKMIIRSFLDYSTGFGNVNDKRGFDMTRAFLGYNYKFSRTLQGQVIIDGASGKTAADGLEVYVRNAFVNWNDKGFNVNVGLTGSLQFSTQESYWMHRYVMKSFQDLNGMAPSVDMGVTAEYAFSPYISADLSITNGEGYKKIKKDKNMRYAAGISLRPLKNTIFRIYADVYNDDEKQRDALPEGITDVKYKNQYTLSLFAGYQNQQISFGAEYNRVYNKGFIEKKDYYGYSFYASAKLTSKWRAFARYDLTDSSEPAAFTSPWNKQDGQLIVAGVEFKPLKQLKIAPNFRNINADRAKAEQYLFINVEFNL